MLTERPEKVLIVEDDIGVARLERRHLERAGYSVISAATAAEALEAIASGEVALMVLDLRLAGNVSGFDVYGEVKAAGYEIPVIMVTGFSDEATAIRALRAGVRDFVTKSIEYLDYLPEAVTRVLRQVRMEEEVRRMEERFQFIARATNDVIWDWDIAAGTFWWSPSFYHQFKLSPEEVLPGIESWKSRIHPDDVEQVLASTGEFLRGSRSTWTMEYRLRRGDGTYAEVFDRAYLIHNEHGRPVRMVGSLMDVTERKQHENALRESNERFRAVTQSANDAIISIDSSGTIVFWNRAAERLFQYSESEALGQSVEILMPAHQRFLLWETVGEGRSRIRRLQDATIESTGRRKDGTEFPSELSLSHWETKAGVFHSAIVRDLTERKRTEAALRQTEMQLRQAQKLDAVGQLAGGVAHEFNNLLQAITGYNSFAMDTLGPASPAYEDLVQLEKAAERAATLTRQLLSFGRRQVLRRKKIDPNQVVHELLQLLRPIIGVHIDLRTQLALNVGTIDADETLLQQVLLNLCVNARDAMPDGGLLQISTRRIVHAEHSPEPRLHSMKPGEYVLLEVSDTGSGIPAEFKQHIFEPFFTTKSAGKGTGLGLSMAYGIIQQHQGLIDVESEPGLGATFRIYLPLVASAPDPAKPAGHEHASGGRETILVADDDSAVREVAVRVLERAGYRVLMAVDGADALAVFDRHADQISLVILDVLMPHIGGYEAYLRMRTQRPGVRVLFCSGYEPDSSHPPLALESGHSVLQKPYAPATLLRIVRERLDAPVTSGVCVP